MQTGLGSVTIVTPGTPVRVAFQSAVLASMHQSINPPTLKCQSILMQALSNASHTNTGRVYILDQNRTRVATLAVPTANTIPSFSATIPNAMTALNAGFYSIDADNAGDGVDVSILTP